MAVQQQYFVLQWFPVCSLFIKTTDLTVFPFIQYPVLQLFHGQQHNLNSFLNCRSITLYTIGLIKNEIIYSLYIDTMIKSSLFALLRSWRNCCQKSKLFISKTVIIIIGKYVNTTIIDISINIQLIRLYFSFRAVVPTAIFGTAIVP
jgi:hypothetical protein